MNSHNNKAFLLRFFRCQQRPSSSRAVSVARRWPGTLFRILSGTKRAVQAVLGVCTNVLVCTASEPGVLNDTELCKSTHSLHTLPSMNHVVSGNKSE